MNGGDWKRNWRFLSLALFASAPFVLSYGIAFWSIVFPHAALSSLGWEARPGGHRWFITEVDEHGPAAGKLKVGDRLIAIDGSARAAEFGPSGAISRPMSGTQYAVAVERSGHAVNLILKLWRVSGLPLSELSLGLLSLLDFVVALWIAIARPEFKTAQLGFLAFLAGAQTFLSPVLTELRPSLHGFFWFTAIVLASSIWRPLELAVAYDFNSHFPEPVVEEKFWRWLRVSIYCLAAAEWLPGALLLAADLFNLSSRSALLPPWFPLELFDRHAKSLRDAFGVLVCLACVVVLIRNYRRVPGQDARRRLRWAALGLSLGSFPFAVETGIGLLIGWTAGEQAGRTAYSAIDPVATAASALAPILLAYAVIKHRVLGIRVAIRRGVQYLLAKNVLRLVAFAPLIAIAIKIVVNRDRPLEDIVLQGTWFYLVLTGVAVISLLYRKQMRNWIDRKFFRTTYEQEAVLVALIDRIQVSDSMDEVARVVARELELTFHSSKIFVFYRKQSTDSFIAGYLSDVQEAERVRQIMNKDFQVARGEKTASEFAREIFGVNECFPNGKSEVLVTAITGTDRNLVGLLVLGRKRSEEDYSDRDRRLVQAIATQISMAHEVLALKERVREEQKIRVEVLGRLDGRQIQLVKECPRCGCCFDSTVGHCVNDGSQLTLMLPVERIIDGKYRLDRRIGAGGMGAVYEASDLRLNRAVAVKIMTGRLFGNQAALRRFEREARAAAKLTHPNIIAIHDFGNLSGEGSYLVMELIAGQSWREALELAGQMQPPIAAELFDQLCNAMSYAHGHGVVHRDLKPENVMLSNIGSGTAKVTVLDFGLAKIRPDKLSPTIDLTTEGVIAGTYAYMSPEQRSGGVVDARTDIFAMGAMIVESLSGVTPPASGASVTWMHSVLFWSAPNLVTTQLLNLLEYCLAENPLSRTDRIQTAQQYLIPLLRNCPRPTGKRAAAASGGETMAADA